MYQSLLDEENNANLTNNLEFTEQARERTSSHRKKINPKTPEFSYREVRWFPEFRVSEWLWHTQKMLVFEWFPLTYFAIADIIAPRDVYGCHYTASKRVESLIVWVCFPVLMMRFIGLVFMNKSNLIIYQFLMIYGYQMVALAVWDINTIRAMNSAPRVCFQPLKLSMCNLIAMNGFYLFMLIPYLSIIAVLPYYFYRVFKNANKQRQKKLAKYYLIKAMPSFLFDKKLFDEGAYNECAICMEEFQEKEDFVTPLACDARHFYHSDCIEEWLQSKNECPLCKKVQTPNMMR